MGNNSSVEKIQLKDVKKSFSGVTVLNLNITIPNEFVAIVGKSGAGKTTLLNILGLLDNKYEGEYTLAKSGGNPDEIRNQKIGFIFQNYNLLSNKTAIENILLPLQFSTKNVDMIYYKYRAYKILNELQLLHKFSEKIENLSGGEKQRIAICRAFILNPDIILADEPTGNLDELNEKIVMEFLKNNAQDKTIILITHNKKLLNYAQRVYELKEGDLHEMKN